MFYNCLYSFKTLIIYNFNKDIYLDYKYYFYSIKYMKKHKLLLYIFLNTSLESEFPIYYLLLDDEVVGV